MEDIRSEIATLHGRYRRLIQFDRILWILYGFSAAIPAYLLFRQEFARSFHMTGIVTILAVGYYGWRVDTSLLRGSIRSEDPAYVSTGLLVLSRMLIGLIGIFYVTDHAMQEMGATYSFRLFYLSLPRILLGPELVTMGLIGGFYRVIYHISVHFLLKMQGRFEPRT